LSASQTSPIFEQKTVCENLCCFFDVPRHNGRTVATSDFDGQGLKNADLFASYNVATSDFDGQGLKLLAV